MKKILSVLLAVILTAAVFPATGLFAITATAANPSALDLTTTEHLPPIGNQGGVGCCASMSITYMQFTNAVSRYLHSIDPDITWNPSSGDPAYCFSPRFTYNLAGSGTAWVYEILKEQGCLPQTYGAFSGGVTGAAIDNTTAKNWAADKGLWSLAQNYRVSNYDQIWLSGSQFGGYKSFNITGSDAGRELIQRIKDALNAGNAVVTGGYVSYWQNALVSLSNTGTLGKAGDQAIPYSTEGDSNVGGHQVTIVGYDDNITCVKNGVVLKGAFKLANSWGTDWRNGGYLWMMYDAFNGKDQSPYAALNVSNRIWTMDQVVFLDWRTDLNIGTPELTAELTLTANDREAFSVTLTRKDRASGYVETYTPYMFRYYTRRPFYAKGMSLTFNGKSSTNESTAVLAFNYDELLSLPSGKTVDDYIWGVRVSGIKDGQSVTVDRFALFRSGVASYVAGDLSEVVSSGAEKNYTASAARSGVWSGGGWNFENGVLNIYGSGAMDNYKDDLSARPWASFADKIAKVVIDDGVTSIGSGAFENCAALARVICGADVYKIGDRALAGDRALREIVFNAPISSIGKDTVDGSTGIGRVTVTGQTLDAFLAVAALKSGNDNYMDAIFTEKSLYPDEVFAQGSWNGGTWKLENHVLTITGSGKMNDYPDNGSPWAAYADEIQKVVIGDGITTVGARAFSHFGELQEVICGKNVYRLNLDAFAYSTVQSLVFYRKISMIEQGVVYSCSALQSVATTDQTKEQFLTVAHKSNYNTAFDGAVFTTAVPRDVFDVDGSGIVNIVDVTAYLAKLMNGVEAPDLDGDGASTIRDVTALLNRLAS